MNSSPHNQQQRIDDQATAWFALLRGDSVTVSQQADFAKWLAIEHDHQAAFDELTELWAALKEPLEQIAIDQASLDANSTAQESAQKPPRMTQPVRFALAASTVLAVSAGLLVTALSVSPINGSAIDRWAGLWQGLSTSGQHAVTTTVGEQRNLNLTDGSQVTLNTRSSLIVSIDDDGRDMTLASGQAYFDVAKDASRPFRVSAGDVTATAIGTAFSVRRTAKDDGATKTTIVVEEGIVEITLYSQEGSQEGSYEGGDSATEPLRLGADQQAEIFGGVIQTSSIHADSATAWRHGQLIYSDVPLATIIADLNRYLPHPMTIGSDKLAAVKVSAVLQLSRQSDMLDALSHALPMSWQLMSDSLVVIKPTSAFQPELPAIDEA